jgi:hypothetical protein
VPRSVFWQGIAGFYQRALSFDVDVQQEERLRAMLPLVLVRMMHYFGEFAAGSICVISVLMMSSG